MSKLMIVQGKHFPDVGKTSIANVLEAYQMEVTGDMEEKDDDDDAEAALVKRAIVQHSVQGWLSLIFLFLDPVSFLS
jgi:hypothetical protein